MSRKEVRKHLKSMGKWELKGKMLVKYYKFRNFLQAMKFVNKIARLAEREQHHPDILIFSWNNVKISTYTHSINGLSLNDFILAAKINKIN